MTARAARIRTESMAVRLSKQPISEGYALWDKGYALGAMRLFIFKAESVPPFQLASCLDAIAHLMMEVHENEDAVENFSTAAEKYDMIQNPILAKLMRAKILEAQDNVKDALGATLAILSEHDENPSVTASKDQKTKTALARCYHYAAELLAARDEIVDALSKAQLAVKLGWDRVHCGHVLLGVLYQTQGNLEAAFAAYQSAIASNGNCIAAVEGAIYVLKESERWAEMIPLLDKALAIQPRLNLINEKAMALSNSGNDQEALVILDKYIESPPMEELDPTTVPTSPSILYKAKAAILADSGKFELAAQTLEAALAKFSGEEDVKEMLDQIKKAAVGEE